jgi:hypothetical protein
VYCNRDVGGVDVRIPAQLVFHVFLDFTVGSHGILRNGFQRDMAMRESSCNGNNNR